MQGVSIPDARDCDDHGELMLPKGGKLLSPERSARLTAVDAALRQHLIESYVRELQRKRREANRKNSQRVRRQLQSLSDLVQGRVES